MLKRILLCPFYHRHVYHAGDARYYRRDWFDCALFMGAVIGAVLVFLLLLGAIIVPTTKYLNETYYCPEQAANLRLRNEGWSRTLGCLVEYEGKVVPVDKLRWVR